MPFVPIGSRKPHPVVLDDQKESIAAEQRSKDEAKIKQHYAWNPSAAGYRFGNHPMTKGFVRGPDVPFKGATSPWKPSTHVQDGPHAQSESRHQSVGAYWEGAHAQLGSMRKSDSSPTLSNAAQESLLACHPLSTELRRWESLAKVTERGEVNKDLEKSMSLARQPRELPKPPPKTGGLVNFPKYMLIHNCHLKHSDLQRFQREQADQARLIEDATLRGDSLQDDSLDTSTLGDGPVRYQEASWGAPLLKNRDSGMPWAGAALPSGRGSRHSSTLRMG